MGGRDRKGIQLAKSKAGHEVYISEKQSNLDMCRLESESENNPDKIETLLVNAGYPPTLLKVHKEDLVKI